MFGLALNFILKDNVVPVVSKLDVTIDDK